MEIKEINELRSRMHLDIMAAVQEFEKKTGLWVSDVAVLRAVQETRRPAVIRGIHTDLRLPL